MEDQLPEVGRNCRIGIADKDEIVQLTEELQDMQRWFEEFGEDGILFPHSIINSFPQRTLSQAA
jgi:hypothetical protein